MGNQILLSVLNYLQRCFLRVIEELEIDEKSIANMAIMIEQKNISWNNRDLRRILARHYRVTRTLLRHRNIYIHPFTYRRGTNGELVVSLDNKVPFIFNIYRGANITNRSGENYHLLAKVRILQYLIKKQQVEREEIINYLGECFGYNKEYLSSDLNELMTMGLLTRVPRNNEYGSIYYEYTPTRSGINMVKTLMYELSYLEIILDDILVPKSVFEKFRIYTSNTDYTSSIDFSYQSLTKRLHSFPRIVYFVFLVYSLEKQEKRNFILNNRDCFTFDDDFLIHKQLEDSTLITFGKILKGKDASLCNKALSIIQSL